MDPDGDGDPADGIDGWRLDVAREVPVAFWRDWHALVQSINPEAYTVAEEWDEASKFLGESAFDATMNYFGFSFPTKGYLIDSSMPAAKAAAAQRDVAVAKAADEALHRRAINALCMKPGLEWPLDAADAAQEAVASRIGARPDEVRLVAEGCLPTVIESWLGQAPGHLVCSAVEHSNVLAEADRLVARGGRAEIIGVDRTGRIGGTAYEEALPGAGLAVLQAANHEVGTRQPVEAMAEAAAVAVRSVLDPVLAGDLDATWSPGTWSWGRQ
jgi:hypothetical protein